MLFLLYQTFVKHGKDFAHASTHRFRSCVLKVQSIFNCYEGQIYTGDLHYFELCLKTGRDCVNRGFSCLVFSVTVIK